LVRGYFLDWTRDWALRHDLGICGISGESACSLASTDVASISDEELNAALRTEENILIIPRVSPSSIDGKTLPFRKYFTVVVPVEKTVDAIIKKICGPDIPNSYWDQFLELNRTAGIKLNTTLGREFKISAPVCPAPPSQIKIVKIEDQDSHDLWLQVGGVKTGWLDFERPKHEKKSKGVKSKYFIDVLEALNSGFEKKINKPQRGGVRKLGIHLT
jgi:hypothetical protein